MVIFFNPRSTSPGKQPLPLSVLSLAAVLDPAEPWTLVDGNLDDDPASTIVGLHTDPARPPLLATTVMPGPQLTQAIEVCRTVRERAPAITSVWGGYFPTQHAETVLTAPYVDYAVRGQGEAPLLALLTALRRGGALGDVPNLSWKRAGHVVHNAMQAPVSPESLPDIPYDHLRMEDYIQDNYLGRRTVAYHSSFGCPFACSFCAVVAMANQRWLPQSAGRIVRTLQHLVDRYGIDAVQMHDMDFFISEPRVREFSERVTPLGLGWWGLGRVDALMRYSDLTWKAMRASGLKMVFSGAESGSDEMLSRMNKGGTASAESTFELARRAKAHGIVPEFSFVVGCPPDPLEDTERTFQFIRRLKQVNPHTEVILYVYTPVPSDASLFTDAVSAGFAFPTTLDEWASPNWQQLSLRRGDRLPWIVPTVRGRVRNFERVLNAYYPTATDMRLTGARRSVLRAASAVRYWLHLYGRPYELDALNRLMRYQRPETTGF